MNIFVCPKCKSALDSFHCPACGYNIPVSDGVYQFTADPAIVTGNSDLMWLGYENVGVNYEPGLALGHDEAGFGMFGACSRALASVLPDGAAALDIGCGLGQAAIPLAAAGVFTVAADISQTMLSAAVLRANNHGVSDRLISFVRMNAYELMMSGDSVDAVIAIDILHQLNRPALAINEILRVLRPGGYLVRYGSEGVALPPELRQMNEENGRIESDIKKYYYSVLGVGEEVYTPFSSWEEADRATAAAFAFDKKVICDEDVEWSIDLDFRLHKLKTRAAGGAQLIPDGIHESAWRKTEEYAVSKYGSDYGKRKRCGVMRPFIELLKAK